MIQLAMSGVLGAQPVEGREHQSRHQDTEQDDAR